MQAEKRKPLWEWVAIQLLLRKQAEEKADSEYFLRFLYVPYAHPTFYRESLQATLLHQKGPRLE